LNLDFSLATPEIHLGSGAPANQELKFKTAMVHGPLTATTQIVKPRALRHGDTVAVIAPASPVDAESLHLGCDVLRSLGYVPVYHPSILAQDLYFAGSWERRARELEEMFVRADVKAIVCARGGYGCNYLLPHLNLDLIRNHPKIFVGYSDVTSLLTWIHDATGLVTFHGPMVAKDFAVAHGVDLPSWEAKIGGRSELQNAALLQPVIKGKAQGKFYGGCLSMLVASLGTPYEIKTEGVILFVEDVATKPYQIDRMVMQLKMAGKLAGVRGIVFGCMKDCAPPPHADYTLVDVIRRVLSDVGVPVAFGLNSGHVERSNLTVPLGTQAVLEVDERFAGITGLETPVVRDAEPERQ
jgi:muramoyltetrapeptide carboxypeptidase